MFQGNKQTATDASESMANHGASTSITTVPATNSLGEYTYIIHIQKEVADGVEEANLLDGLWDVVARVVNEGTILMHAY